MGRDRAKEKIQAHRKAKLERKEAKTEQRHQQRADVDKRHLRTEDGTSKASRDQGTASAAAAVEESGWEAFGKKETVDSPPDFGRKQTDARIQSTEDELLLGEDSPLSQKSKTIGGANENINLIKSFYSGGNPNRRDVKPVWRVEHEESMRAKKRKSIETSNNTVASSWSSSKLQDYFSSEDIQAVKAMWGAKHLENISFCVAAVSLNRFDILKKILKDNTDTLEHEGQYLSPLGCAIVTINWEMIEFLLDKDVPKAMNCQDSFGNTALIKAALCPSWSEAEFCDLFSRVENEDVDLLGANMAGVTLVHALSYRGWNIPLQSVIDILGLRSEKPIGTVVNAIMKDGTTPLMLAAENLCEEVCTLLFSKGADPAMEDKAGYSALCRSLSNSALLVARNCMPPIVKLILIALDELEDKDWNFEIYFSKVMQAVLNPPSEAIFSCERFYRFGRFVFLFILRCIQGGSDILLKSKFFNKLCTAGQKRLPQTDFVYTICLTLFEVLVYSEDLSNAWNKFVTAFSKDGADFCLKVLQRFTSIVDSDSKDTSLNSHSKCQSNSLDCEGNDNRESLAFIDTPVPSEKNVPLSAIMPFIQVIDAVGMQRWFSRNFVPISSCYKNMQQIDGLTSNTILTGDHIDRTNKKAAIFHAVMNQEKWTPMFRENTDTESWMPRENKHKKNRKPPAVLSNHANLKICFPFGILRPPMHLQCINDNECSKIKAQPNADVVPDNVSNKLPVTRDIAATTDSVNIRTSVCNSDLGADQKYKFVKHKVSLGPYKEEKANTLKVLENSSKKEKSSTPIKTVLSTPAKKLEKRDAQQQTRKMKDSKQEICRSKTETIKDKQENEDKTQLSVDPNLHKKGSIRTHICKFSIKSENDVEWVTSRATDLDSLLNMDYFMEVTPIDHPFVIAQNAIRNPKLILAELDLSPTYISDSSLEQLRIDLLVLDYPIQYSDCTVGDFLFQEGWSTCCDAELWKYDRDYWNSERIMCFSPDGLFIPETEDFIQDFFDFGYISLLYNESDRLEEVTYTQGPRLFTNFEKDDFKYFLRQQIMCNALSLEYFDSLLDCSIALDTMTHSSTVFLFTTHETYHHGLHHWIPLHFSRKYIYKPMSKVSNQEMFEDFVNTYPTVSPLFKDPSWTAFGQVCKSWSPADIPTDVYVPIMGCSNSTISGVTLQLELAFESVYMSESQLWTGVYRQIPNMNKFDYVAGFRAEYKSFPDLADGYVKTTLLGLLYNGTSTNSNLKSVGSSPPPRNEPKMPRCDSCNCNMLPLENTRKDCFESRTRKVSVYQTADNFSIFSSPHRVPNGAFTEVTKVNYANETENNTAGEINFTLGCNQNTENCIPPAPRFNSNHNGSKRQKKEAISQQNSFVSPPDCQFSFKTSSVKPPVALRRTVAVQTSRRFSALRRIDN